MKFLYVLMMLLPVVVSAQNETTRRPLSERIHPARCAARVLGAYGTMLLHCGAPVDRFGYVAVLTALALQSSHP